MMRANELVVGDWVRIIDPDKYAGAKCRIESIDDREGVYYRVFIYDGSKYGCFKYEVFQEDIAPIPLTQEILEKNGWMCCQFWNELKKGEAIIQTALPNCRMKNEEKELVCPRTSARTSPLWY